MVLTCEFYALYEDIPGNAVDQDFGNINGRTSGNRIRADIVTYCRNGSVEIRRLTDLLLFLL